MNNQTNMIKTNMNKNKHMNSGPNAPMYKSLIDSNIGSDYAAGTGYDAHTK